MNKNIFSLISCFLVCVVIMQYRVSYSDIKQGGPHLKITEWDALGYYLYLPSIFIYHDYKELKWLPAIDQKYAVSGGTGYPAIKQDNGVYTFKYLGGVALLESPFFFIGHWVAHHYGYPPDGFSPPYQYALTFGVLLYCFLGIFLLRKVLLRFFSDATTALTLLAVCLATNFIEYAAIENGQSHAFIFPLYILVLYTTMRWHRKPTIVIAALTGYVIGLATMCRPTEAIMLFIPIMWDTQAKESAHQKWQMVKAHRSHVVAAAICGLLGVLPQMIYWKFSTGSFIFDVGSSWDFLSPHFRVLFGWEKGWFIYTPITVFFIVGMFFIRKYPFRKAVLWFCILNIYIIIGWRDWHYGGSYSTRALMQSYPMFALPFAAFAEQIQKKWKWLLYLVCAYLIGVNLFQITQYRSGVIHYDEMNRAYYSRVYLNPSPTPLDISLLDDKEMLNESKYTLKKTILIDTPTKVAFPYGAVGMLYTAKVSDISSDPVKERWLKVESSILAPHHLWQTYLNADLKMGDSVKHTRVRLFRPLFVDSAANDYCFYLSIPAEYDFGQLNVYLSSPFSFDGVVEKVKISEFESSLTDE